MADRDYAKALAEERAILHDTIDRAGELLESGQPEKALEILNEQRSFEASEDGPRMRLSHHPYGAAEDMLNTIPTILMCEFDNDEEITKECMEHMARLILSGQVPIGGSYTIRKKMLRIASILVVNEKACTEA